MSAALRSIHSSKLALLRTTERSFVCSDGLQLAAIHWTSSWPTSSSTSCTATCISPPASASPPPTTTKPTKQKQKQNVLCLHGWLDNAVSFYRLGPGLVNASSCNGEKYMYNVVALDLPGHGLSSHRSRDGPILHLADYLVYVVEAIQSLGWEKTTIIGHSMGSAVALLLSAVYPELVDRQVLLEGVAPFHPRNPEQITKQLRELCDKQNNLLRRVPVHDGDTMTKKSSTTTTSDASVFASLQEAVNARMDAFQRNSPGRQYLSRDAAQQIIIRGSTRISVDANRNNVGDGTCDNGYTYVLRHDPRLLWPPRFQFTKEEIEQLLEDVQCPTCIIQAKDGWPIDPTVQETVQAALKPTGLHHHWLQNGSHHAHAHPTASVEVLKHVLNFMETA